ncbi:MAG: ATP-binding protein [Saprospiraceae bacterium]
MDIGLLDTVPSDKSIKKENSHYNEESRESQIYNDLIRAYTRANSKMDSQLRKKALLDLINFDLFRRNKITLVTDNLSELKMLRNSSLDSLIILYLELKVKHEFALKNDDNLVIDKNQWNEALRLGNEIPSDSIVSLIYNLKALYHELHENNLAKAIEAYFKSLYHAAKVKSDFYELRKFSSFANIGNIKQNEKKFASAIKFYNKSLISISNDIHPLSKIRLYEWFSDCFFALNKYDSSYHYLKLSYNAKVDYDQVLQHNAVTELQEKYQNQKLSTKLSTETIKSKKLTITTLSLGGLFTLSLLALWGIRRINRLKQITLNQQIKETQQQGHLAAINAQLDGEEQERKRVATALHDGISSHLAAAAVHLQIIEQKHKGNGNDSIQKANHLIKEASERSRKLSHDLYPPILIQNGLIAALEALALLYSNDNLTIECLSHIDSLGISKKLEAKLYYIINEAIQNVIKHSRATSCTIRLQYESNLNIIITDNGIGLSPDQSKNGMGIQSMTARIVNEGGIIKILDNRPTGTTIHISIP